MNDWKTFLFGLSIGLNIAFLAVWGFFVLEDTLDRHGVVEDGYRGDKSHWKKNKEDHDRPSGEWFYRKKLGVSDSQWESIKPRLKTFHRDAYRLCKEIGEKRNELIGLIASGNVSDSVVEEKKQTILELKRRKQSMAIDYFSEKKDQLTPAQETTFFDMLRRKPHCGKHLGFIKKKDSGPRRDEGRKHDGDGTY